ncbi:DUF2508 family protein [Paenibacillus radicis (ex Gao et al. 2016)]|uniref:DUF2508 family protein n=1 Tax=Paenibacillus radicis (ex Gao et al. 2016) TaxID=1737354 RepID=A0A917HQ25_9BACL|nr:DUF2508 family protein [Paenibacillus radicis (ex Gao et al. 2016)]GGG86694.1 hypothetical protein GCM10010918_51120 [Paenibacillus radicis (ex Gao et al. 2016)]
MGMLKLRQREQEVRTESKRRAAVEMDTIQWTEHLRSEIAEAHQEWVNANRFFDVAEGQDQIDYAIYSIITAEKRYEMLLRVAKRTCRVWPEWKGALR